MHFSSTVLHCADWEWTECTVSVHSQSAVPTETRGPSRVPAYSLTHTQTPLQDASLPFVELSISVRRVCRYTGTLSEYPIHRFQQQPETSQVIEGGKTVKKRMIPDCESEGPSILGTGSPIRSVPTAL